MSETYDDRRANASHRMCEGGCGRFFYFVTPHQICAECWRINYRKTVPSTLQEIPPVVYGLRPPLAVSYWHLQQYSLLDIVVLTFSFGGIGLVLGWALKGYLGL